MTEQSDADKCVYIGHFNNIQTIIVLYVGDGLLITKDMQALNTFISAFKQTFAITFFVGLEIERKDESIFIHFNSHITNMLKKFRFCDIKCSSTPADSNTVLTKDMDSNEVDENLYIQAVESLVFAAITVRTDIGYAVNLVSGFQNKPTQAHWNAVKRIFQYLKLTATRAVE